MLVLRNGYILENNQKIKKELLIDGDKVVEIADHIVTDAPSYDCKENLILPGFIDVHVHLREPGFEYKETIATGTKAAAKGGFTTIMPMPNTNPTPDSIDALNAINQKINEDALIRVIPYATITKKQQGQQLVDFEALATAHMFGFSDDGVGVQNAAMMYEAMLQAKKVNKPIVAHCEENSLIYNGVMHEGKRSKALGLIGIPSICESTQIARDVLLAEASGCHYHVCHVSTKESVRVIKDAKKAGIHVTCEVTPHHLISNENDIPSDNGLWKMNPPLRSEEDQQALLEGLRDGTIDCIATDHAPHASEEKECSFNQAKFGIIGLEHAFGLCYSELVQTNKLTLQQLVDALTIKPATIFNLEYGTYNTSDLVIVDLEKQVVIDRNNCVSKSNNTPYDKKRIKGVPIATIYRGNIVWEEQDEA